ncbi:MAG: bifunctional oligoribonuclease/PAP phosphatase NrnA [Bacillota bacterium]|nr:bifunctional oligoribonuclease/PAP phosphatase NrnA [Bacillota bacterium]
MTKDRKKIIDVLKNEKEFYLISHMLPDGDSIGSLLSMGAGLRLIGKKIDMFTPGHIPRKYEFMIGSGDVRHEDMLEDHNRTVVVLDSSDPDRLGIFKETVLKSRQIINIDHHVTNQRFGHLNLVDPNASATGELVFHILHDVGVKLNAGIAEALYVAISTDTGSFKYDNTTPDTHRVVSSLLEYGLSPGALSQRMFDERPLSFYILLKEALASLEMYEERKIAVMTISKDVRERSGATTDDLEGIVNYSRNIEGVELGILFYVENENEVKVGFRSKSLDVSVLAGKLNGGGHVRAAGCRQYGDFETVKKRVMQESLNMLRELSA